MLTRPLSHRPDIPGSRDIPPYRGESKEPVFIYVFQPAIRSGLVRNAARRESAGETMDPAPASASVGSDRRGCDSFCFPGVCLPLVFVRRQSQVGSGRRYC